MGGGGGGGDQIFHNLGLKINWSRKLRASLMSPVTPSKFSTEPKEVLFVRNKTFMKQLGSLEKSYFQALLNWIHIVRMLSAGVTDILSNICLTLPMLRLLSARAQGCKDF